MGRTIQEAVLMKGITKRFPGVLANDHIDFDALQGEIHVLLGENGAGKTTLMNILYGLYRPDEGEIYVKGRRVRISSPRDAIALGINMIHQHFMLVPRFTVAENIVLNTKPQGWPILDLRRISEEISELAMRYGLEVDPMARVDSLSVGEQQRVEILKMLYRKAEILIMDEPTAVLSPPEIRELFRTLRRMVKEGKTIILITHKLREALEIGDRITVLRKGRVVATVRHEEASETELIRMMVGREVLFRAEKLPVRSEEPVFRVWDLEVLDDRGLPALRGVSFDVKKGEIFGIAGVAGNGQKELIEAILGLRRVESGSIFLRGEEITNRPLSYRMGMNIAYIPEDRVIRGLIPDFNLMDNSILGIHRRKPFARNLGVIGIMNYGTVRKHAMKLINSYSIVAQSEEVLTKYLSGGNLQRLLIAREFYKGAALLIAEQPTRGLDVSASEYVRRKIVEMRNKGAGVLLISGDLDEILSLSDRIGVMYEGRLFGPLNVDEVDVEVIGMMMVGEVSQDDS